MAKQKHVGHEHELDYIHRDDGYYLRGCGPPPLPLRKDPKCEDDFGEPDSSCQRQRVLFSEYAADDCSVPGDEIEDFADESVDYPNESKEKGKSVTRYTCIRWECLTRNNSYLAGADSDEVAAGFGRSAAASRDHRRTSKKLT